MWDSKASRRSTPPKRTEPDGGVVKATGQFGQGGLAAAGGADQGQPLARLDPQVDPFQHQALIELLGIDVVVGADAVGEVDTDSVPAAPLEARR